MSYPGFSQTFDHLASGRGAAPSVQKEASGGGQMAHLGGAGGPPPGGGTPPRGGQGYPPGYPPQGGAGVGTPLGEI